MAKGTRKKHILLPRLAAVTKFKRPKPGRPPKKKIPEPPDDRAKHARALIQDLQRAVKEGMNRRSTAATEVQTAPRGTTIEIVGQPNVEFGVTALGDRRVGIELLSLRMGDGAQERAVVFIPETGVEAFEKKFRKYLETAMESKTKNRAFVDNVTALGAATVESLWTDPTALMPRPGRAATWWELWLRQIDGTEIDQVRAQAKASDIKVDSHTLRLLDRTVMFAHATFDQIAGAIPILNIVSELRLAQHARLPAANRSATAQERDVKALRSEIHSADSSSPTVCLLDTGVNSRHPLLTPAMALNADHTVLPTRADVDGHGTKMAGLAAYGDLQPLLAVRRTPLIRLEHRLESVKVFSERAPQNRHRFGSVTADGVRVVELASRCDRRAFTMAVAGADTERGAPTSWSVSVDDLCAGYNGSVDAGPLGLEHDRTRAARRLFIVSAGNVDPIALDADPVDQSVLKPIEDPGQAWNALTVGGMTELSTISAEDAELAGWRPMAQLGDLSPHSATGASFDRDWPYKPDVVFEAGNVAVSPNGTDSREHVASLTVCTTRNIPTPPLTTFCGTSAATAQAGRLAARIWAANPTLWPETVRGLIAHSGRWTERMRAQFESANKGVAQSLLRLYGYGVPDERVAVASATDHLTLLAQGELRPYLGRQLGEMALYDLPWPTDELRNLAATEVKLRVTLSYFVDPNPARRGWRGPYRYASHGLRFEVRKPGESMKAFAGRVNAVAAAELDEWDAADRPAPNDPRWTFGVTGRVKGSLHHDIWTGSAAELADRGAVAVFPVSGWWKDRPAKDKQDRVARYALIVSIESPRADVDIWTPVEQQVTTMVSAT